MKDHIQFNDSPEEGMVALSVWSSGVQLALQTLDWNMVARQMTHLLDHPDASSGNLEQLTEVTGWEWGSNAGDLWIQSGGADWTVEIALAELELQFTGYRAMLRPAHLHLHLEEQSTQIVLSDEYGSVRLVTRVPIGQQLHSGLELFRGGYLYRDCLHPATGGLLHVALWVSAETLLAASRAL